MREATQDTKHWPFDYEQKNGGSIAAYRYRIADRRDWSVTLAFCQNAEIADRVVKALNTRESDDKHKTNSRRL